MIPDCNHNLEKPGVRLAVRIALSALIVAGFAAGLPAQNSVQDWAGEWGEYHLPPGNTELLGHHLTVTNCTGDQCKFWIRLADTQGSCNISKYIGKSFEIETPIEAVAELYPSSLASHCSLIFQKSGSDHPVITVKVDGDCSSYCSGKVSFAGTFPLRSRSAFFADDIESCYAAGMPARAALCASQQLSAQQEQWSQLDSLVSEIYPKMFDSEKQKKIIAACDAAKDPAACLANDFQQAINELNALLSKWQTAEMQQGDPAEAKRKVAAITGSYRHTFRNGDMSGDTYWSTDTLEIQRASDHSILYSTELNFSNGHSCSKSGEAIYNSKGFFVDHGKNDIGETCYFEVIPTATGVDFGDPTGQCKETNCGTRGSFHNTHFSFKRRIAREGKVHLDSGNSGDDPATGPAKK